MSVLADPTGQDRTLAHITAGIVDEIKTTRHRLETLFPPTFRASWVDATGLPGAVIGAAAVEQNGVWNFTAPGAHIATLADRLAELAAIRYAKETGGIDYKPAAASGSLVFATDRQSQSQISSANSAAVAGKWVDGAPWKVANGNFIPMLAADIETLAAKVMVHVQGCFSREASLTTALDGNIDTDLTQGWPSNA